MIPQLNYISDLRLQPINRKIKQLLSLPLFSMGCQSDVSGLWGEGGGRGVGGAAGERSIASSLRSQTQSGGGAERSHGKASRI